MADDSVTNGEFFDDAPVEIFGDDDSSKISELKQKIAALEQEKVQLLHENDVIKQRVEKLKTSIDESQSEKSELHKKVEKFESENKVLDSVASRAAELEAEVSRLQHDLITAMSDLESSNAELTGVKSALEGLKSSENEKSVKLDAVESERNLLLSKLEKLEAVGKQEVKVKDEEIRGLKKHIEDLEGTVANNVEWEKEKSELQKVKEELETRVKEMMVKAAELENKLKEKERVITDRLVQANNINGIPVGDDSNKSGYFGGELNLPLVAASSVVAVAVVGGLCYLRCGRKA